MYMSKNRPCANRNGFKYIPKDTLSTQKYCIIFGNSPQARNALAVIFIPKKEDDSMARRYKKRKDGRYATTVMVGYKPDGRANNIFVAAKTEKELRDKIAEIKIKAKTGEIIKQSDMLLQDYIESWMETYKAAASINTKAMYTNAVKTHICPALGYLPLNKIVRSDVQRLINDNQDHPRTCEIIKMTLVQILNSAIEDKLIHDNVAKKVVLPKRHKSDKRALTDLEKEAIKKADFTTQEHAFVMLLFYFGLRRGETLALTKSDIDLKKRTLTVNKAVVFDVNTPIVKAGAKSDAGNRSIPIPEGAVPFLRDFLKSVDTFYLFPGKYTETLSKTQYVKMWDRIVKKMNDAVITDKEKIIGSEPITGLTAHIFRHNYCTMLYYSGISQKKAVELMGHSDIKMIMEVYAHLDEKKEAVQEKINNAIAL